MFGTVIERSEAIEIDVCHEEYLELIIKVEFS